MEGEETFNTFFFQKWGFFAPPPKYNDRLYYTFESKNDTTQYHTFEVMAPLQKRKSTKAPFNSSEDILDYVLSSTLHSISDGLYAVNESLSYQEDKIDSLKPTKADRIEKGKLYTESTTNFQTLKNYAYLVAKKNGVNTKDYRLIIEITQVEMPQFADRDLLNTEEEVIEKIVYKSDKIIL